jgi:hypothetical protein
MADAAAVPDQLAVAQFPQGAAALGTREAAGGPFGAVPALLDHVVGNRHVHMLAHHAGDVRKSGERGTDLHGRKHLVRPTHRGQRVLGHAGDDRVGRVLDDHGAARPRNRQRPARTVAERTGQDHRGRGRTVGVGQRAQHRVHGGPDAVLLGTAREHDLAVAHEQVAVRRRDEDVPGRQRLGPVGRHDGERRVAAQDASEHAPTRRRDVEHDADGVRLVRRQRRHELDEHVHAARRGADADDSRRRPPVAADSGSGHGASVRLFRSEHTRPTYGSMQYRSVSWSALFGVRQG